MIRRNCLISVAALLILAAIPATASARESTVIWQANLRIPIVGTTALGTLVTVVDDHTGEGTWHFQGTINGYYAQASGAGEISGSGCTATVSMTRIDTWMMPGIDPPALPSSATVRTIGNLGYVTLHSPPLSSGSFAASLAKNVPVAISEPVCFPVQSGTYTLTTPGKGEDTVTVLPDTGSGSIVEPGGQTLASRAGDAHAMLLLLGTTLAVLWAGSRLHRRLTEIRQAGS